MQIYYHRKNKNLPRYFIISTLFLLITTLPTSAQDTNSIDTLRQMGRAFTQIANKASPAVVGIKAKQLVTQQYHTMPEGPFYGYTADFKKINKKI